MDQFFGVKTEEVQVDGLDTFNNHRYEPSSYGVLKVLFNELKLTKDDCLVDYGSGLGRVNFYLDFCYHVKSKGVEMSKHYFDLANENLANYLGDRSNIEFYNCLAEDYLPAEEDNYFYFFNPFSKVVFKKVINKIVNSYHNYPRDLYLILYYPENETVFYIEQHTEFSLVFEIAASPDVRSNYRERFVVYSLKNIVE